MSQRHFCGNFPQKPVSHTPSKNSEREEWHDLGEHLSEVARMAAEFSLHFGAENLGYYAGLWHDLGKFNPEFQEYLQRCHEAAKARKEKGDRDAPKSVPHAIHGAKWAAEIFLPLAPLIFGHHGGIPAADRSFKMKLKGWEGEEEKTEKAYQESVERAKAAGINLNPDLEQFKHEIHPYQKTPWTSELFLRLLFSCLVDADFLDTERHFNSEKSEQREVLVTICQLQATLTKSYAQKFLQPSKNSRSELNQMRAEVYQHCQDAAKLPPGVFRLCVPTGGGKTLSGLQFALDHAVLHDRSRVIFAVPYTSIIEQTVNVYREQFDSELGDGAVLEHHSAVWQEYTKDDKKIEVQVYSGDLSEDARQAFARARLIAQNWDAPLIVTTTVQLFDSLFANRPGRCRKLHNLVNSVIVLDEVQTLPIALLDPILCVLRELVSRYGVTVVLCTATQPALESDDAYLKGFPPGSVRDIVPLERAKAHFQLLQRVNYVVPPGPWSWAELVADLGERGGDRALIVLNTRKDALAVLAALQAAQRPREGLFHLSTLLCGQHRRQVLQTVRDRLKAGLPCLLVSTQVVEAGVDVDFPLVYRAVGPLDRVVQAAGRCNREGALRDGAGRPVCGQVVVFDPLEGKQPPGEYATAVGTAKDYLNCETVDRDLHDPATFEAYFKELYQKVPRTKGETIQSLRKALNYPEVAAEFSLIDSATMPVVIEYDDRARSLIGQIRRQGALQRSDRAKLQPYLINLPIWEFQKAADCREEVVPGLWVWRGEYDTALLGIAIDGQPVDRDPADYIQ